VEASTVPYRITFKKQHLGQPRPTWAYATQVTLTSVMGHPNTHLGLKYVLGTISLIKVEDKAIPFQAWTGPEGSRKLRLPDFKIIGT